MSNPTPDTAGAIALREAIYNHSLTVNDHRHHLRMEVDRKASAEHSINGITHKLAQQEAILAEMKADYLKWTGVEWTSPHGD